MLVLSRKAGERIQIGDEITVEIRRVAGNRVTVAVEAPRHIRILRGELQQSAESFENPSQTPASVPVPRRLVVKRTVRAVSTA